MNTYTIPCPAADFDETACPGTWAVEIRDGLTYLLGRTCDHPDGGLSELIRADAHAAHNGRQLAAVKG